MNRAILVVSFGTSHKDTCAKTIEAIENDIRRKYPGYPFYRAWTSGVIRRKVGERDGVPIFSVSEALEKMREDGITQMVVLPTHVWNGLENTLMEQEIQAAENQFERVIIGTPLLTTREDREEVAQILIDEWELEEGEMLVLMGHGSRRFSNTAYIDLNNRLISKGYADRMIGTMEGNPSIADIADAVRKLDIHKVVLAPFMIVSGKHVNEEMAGEGADSWKSILEKEGCEVRCVRKGLGEYEGIRKLFLKHLEEAMEKIKE